MSLVSSMHSGYDCERAVDCELTLRRHLFEAANDVLTELCAVEKFASIPRRKAMKLARKFHMYETYFRTFSNVAAHFDLMKFQFGWSSVSFGRQSHVSVCHSDVTLESFLIRKQHACSCQSI